MSDKKETEERSPALSKREEFLNAIEVKTNDRLHVRLLKACRGSDAAKELETELAKIISEILS